jgi:hypothetical protein
MAKTQRVKSKESNVREFPSTRVAPTITHQEIAERAYELFLSRGREDGHHIEDWLAAELSLREERLHDQKQATRETGAL